MLSSFVVIHNAKVKTNTHKKDTLSLIAKISHH